MKNNTDTDKIDATEFYQHLERIRDEIVNQLTIGYTRESNSDGSRGAHRFILNGWCCDGNLFKEISNIIDEYDPLEVRFGNGTKGNIAIRFEDEHIINDPPESQNEWSSVDPISAQSRKITECENCLDRTEPSIPPIKLKYAAENKYSKSKERNISLCVSCTPGHYDDVVRKWKAFGVENNSVTQLLHPSWKEYDDKHSVKEEHPPEWIPRDEIECPYTNSVIKLIEWMILEN